MGTCFEFGWMRARALWLVVLCVGWLTLGVEGTECGSPTTRINCGHVGTTQSECQSSGCCWKEAPGTSLPWCFYPPAPPPSPPHTGIPFNATELATMEGFLCQNLDIGGKGGVAASPDKAVGYYYNWMRDAALATRTYYLHGSATPTEKNSVMTA